MGRYSIVVRKSVSRDVTRIPKRDVRRIVQAIRALAGIPPSPQSQRLSADEKYRLRCGNYRILYEIQDDQVIICVVRVRQRKDIYR